MNAWIEVAAQRAEAGRRTVLATVVNARGSTPREIGAKMVITEGESIGTIGGGRLEHDCTRIARSVLDGTDAPSIRRFSLGPMLGQCCGGRVDVLFEAIGPGVPAWLGELRSLQRSGTPAVLVSGLQAPLKLVVPAQAVFSQAACSLEAPLLDAARHALDRGEPQLAHEHFFDPLGPCALHVAVFGAGHVGRAVVRALASIDCTLRWIDGRPDVFRDAPARVRAIASENPASEVYAMPPGSFYLVMTHSHPLDFELCDRILSRGDAAYCGLIGSRTKRRRFERRLHQHGLAPEQLRPLVCPIGVAGIPSKKPAEIAISTVAQLLQIHHARAERGVNPARPTAEPQWNPS